MGASPIPNVPSTRPKKAHEQSVSCTVPNIDHKPSSESSDLPIPSVPKSRPKAPKASYCDRQGSEESLSKPTTGTIVAERDEVSSVGQHVFHAGSESQVNLLSDDDTAEKQPSLSIPIENEGNTEQLGTRAQGIISDEPKRETEYEIQEEKADQENKQALDLGEKSNEFLALQNETSVNPASKQKELESTKSLDDSKNEYSFGSSDSSMADEDIIYAKKDDNESKSIGKVPSEEEPQNDQTGLLKEKTSTEEPLTASVVDNAEYSCIADAESRRGVPPSTEEILPESDIKYTEEPAEESIEEPLSSLFTANSESVKDQAAQNFPSTAEESKSEKQVLVSQTEADTSFDVAKNSSTVSLDEPIKKEEHTNKEENYEPQGLQNDGGKTKNTPSVPASRPKVHEKETPVVPTTRPKHVSINSSEDTTESASASTVNKKPPPRPKKPSSRIAQFQEMLEQQQKQDLGLFNKPKPKLPAKRPTFTNEIPEPNEKSIGAGDSEKQYPVNRLNSNFAESLNGMIGVGLPGMAFGAGSYEAIRKVKAVASSLSNEDEAESGGTVETDEVNAKDAKGDIRRARAKGPRGRKLPGSLKKVVEVNDLTLGNKFSVQVFDIWTLRTDLKTCKDDTDGPMHLGMEESESTYSGKGLNEDAIDLTRVNTEQDTSVREDANQRENERESVLADASETTPEGLLVDADSNKLNEIEEKKEEIVEEQEGKNGAKEEEEEIEEEKVHFGVTDQGKQEEENSNNDDISIVDAYLVE